MADYNGTDEDDIIDVSELDSDIGNIYPGKGNDTVTNATSKHTIVSSPGEDNISGEKFGYALWNATQGVTINLNEGWSEDGFGTRDTVSGIETIHGTSFGDTVYGSENYERYFANGGNNTIDGGGGGDRVTYAPGRGASTDFEITYVDGSAHVKGENTLDILKNISTIEFMDDSEIYSVDDENGSIFNGTISYGTENYERYFVNGGNNTIDGGGGGDRVIYALGRGASTDFEITYIDGSVHVKGENTLDILKNISTIAFMDDSRIFNVSYFSSPSPIKAKLAYTSYKFYDDTIAPEYTYAGVTTEAQLVSWFAQGGALLDLNEDGAKDVIIPISKGYASGIDGRTPFIALTTEAGKLIYDEEINEYMPNITSSRRTEAIQLVNSETESIVSAHHDTEEESKRNDPDRKVPLSELAIISTASSNIEQSDIIPKLPLGTDDQPYGVDAHSMAVGDINGDGLEDIFIGEISSDPYVLMQESDGAFVILKNDFFSSLYTKTVGTGTLLLDSALVDVNNDGFDDLIAGYGHGKDSLSSRIYINNDGEFNESTYIDLPESIYGYSEQLHMKTMPYDFDNDGDIDLAVQWSRNEPYYGGQYIQILMNDGEGNLTDSTDKIIGGAYEDAYMSRLQWSEPWQLIDLNNDNHMDIAGTRATNNTPIFYLNDGKGVFEIIDVTRDQLVGKAYAFSDFDKDNKIEFVTFYSTYSKWENGKGKESELSLNVYELESEIGTGPNYSTDTAKQGAPGFNEQYYLNENTSAKESVDAGTYETGLEHYLAEGKDASLKSFAPFTKVHGYSGNDTIILREGDETAFGYAGKDTIEGGAGNDAIDGGAGVDTAIYKDSSSAYTLTANDDGTVSVIHSSPSEGSTDEGTDTLTNVEKMQFTDKTLSKTSLKYELSETANASKNILDAHSENAISGTLNFNAGDNIVILDGQGKNYRGLSGDDTYFVSQLIPKNTKLSITDTDGVNIIQIPTNTYVDKSLFTKNAARLTLEDGREITINSADKFSYNVGGNVTNGTKGTDLTFAEFTEVFGVYDILNSSGAQTGSISDMYII